MYTITVLTPSLTVFIEKDQQKCHYTGYFSHQNVPIMWPSPPLLEHKGALLVNRHCRSDLEGLHKRNEISWSEVGASSDDTSTTPSCVPCFSVIRHPLWQTHASQSLALDHHLLKGSSCDPERESHNVLHDRKWGLLSDLAVVHLFYVQN